MESGVKSVYKFGKNEIIKEDGKVIVMDIKASNFFAFENFHMNMSYPRKIKDSRVPNEYLRDRPNFRYKKINILMGGNASGKTSLGRLMMDIFNFIHKKQGDMITRDICDISEEASFSMDFVVSNTCKLYRIETTVLPRRTEEYEKADIQVRVKSVNINKNDSYRICAERLKNMSLEIEEDYIKELEKVKNLSWMFQYPSEDVRVEKIGDERYRKILEYTLRALDPAIARVDKIEKVDDSYIVRMKSQDIIIQENVAVKSALLSSGTKQGIDIANMIAAIKSGGNEFYYCDEKFSYIHSDVEKAFLSVMIACLHDNNQLFFTTHNMDVLDLNLPRHSFVFLKKDLCDETQSIHCISASKYLRRNTDSLKNAVDNDLFSTAPDISLIYEIEEM